MSCIPNRTSPNTEKRIGANGGKYQARFKNADGSWTPWWNLGGGLNASDVEVKLVEAAEQPVGPMWNALLIQHAPLSFSSPQAVHQHTAMAL